MNALLGDRIKALRIAKNYTQEKSCRTYWSYYFVTDDTKQGGPYMSLLQFEDEVMPFTFADVLINKIFDRHNR